MDCKFDNTIKKIEDEILFIMKNKCTGKFLEVSYRQPLYVLIDHWKRRSKGDIQLVVIYIVDV